MIQLVMNDAIGPTRSTIGSVLIIGRLPPPYGGVTASVRNLAAALDRKGISTRFPSARSFFRRYGLGHVNQSKPAKRFAACMLSRLLCRRTVFTLHGNFLDTRNIFNLGSLRLSHGVILLNEGVANALGPGLDARSIPWTILSPIFAEGMEEPSGEPLPFTRDDSIRYCLAYSYAKSLHRGRDLYGVDFLLENLDVFEPEFKLVLLDPTGAYEAEASQLGNRIVYINHPVDTLDLLKGVDLYLRPTTSDGASVALLEALFCGVPALASDAVPRPAGVDTYHLHDRADFRRKLRDAAGGTVRTLSLPSVDEYLSFVQSL